MDAHSVFAPDVRLDRQTFQLASDSPCLKIPGLGQLDTRFGLEPLPWSRLSAVWNVRTSRCSSTNSGQRWSYDASSGLISLDALTSPQGCLMTESILLESGLSTAVFPCDDEGRLGLGRWELVVHDKNATVIQLRSSVLASQAGTTTPYCLGAWVAQGISNARLVSCSDPSAKWGGMYALPSGGAGFHLAATSAQAASRSPQADFAATQCLDACHKRECVLDTSPTINYQQQPV
eukprot:COSAG05_NODE_3256_length_2200_cov_1.449310_1_plen_234_part_00